ncbi:hypothetical protein RN053_02935 [Pantoea dispersa]|uniref:hypothetical protein n=1 Tax=Pantoea dispersa TaxID=59814 RepID=UPI0028E003FF|nr:hypothetical protein [Pantoea dispersa]MDT8849433.1 hypothetical protein [Pantoea dispersa]
MINAIMGLTNTKQLFATAVQGENGPEMHCRELEGKPIGFLLQKVLYTKGDGGDGYRFEIRQAFGTKTRKTYKEAMENLPAEAVDKLLATLSDRDERQPHTHSGMAHTQANQPRSILGGRRLVALAIPRGWRKMPADAVCSSNRSRILTTILRSKNSQYFDCRSP